MTGVATAVELADGGGRFVARRARAWLAPAVAEPAPALPVIDLASGELDRAATPQIGRAVAEALDRGETHYTVRPGIPPLRRALAGRIAAEGGPEYDPAREVLIACGGQEGLFVATQMLVAPGDEVLVQDPGYPAYREAVRLANGVPVPVPVRAGDRYALTAAAVAAALTPRTRLLVLVSPGNPTGGVTPRAELEGIAALARERDLRVICDETYRAFVFDGAEQVSFAALPGMRGRTVTIGSFSATYAMGGWRAGYVVGEPALLHPVTALKQALTICSPAPSQWAALAALEGPQDEPAAAVREVAARRAVVLPALATLGLPTGDPQGGYHVFADVRATGLTGREFAQVALRDAGVRVVPGDRFGAGGAGGVRLSLVRPVPVLEEALARLRDVVEGLKVEGRRSFAHSAVPQGAG